MKKKMFYRILLVVIVLAAAGGIYAYYLWNMPHRDVAAAEIDYHIEATELVNEYLADERTANMKYLDESGDSKILAVTGTVHRVSKNMNDDVVVILKETGEKAGVQFTFSQDAGNDVAGLQKGDIATIKGVIRSGAKYDEIMDLYLDAIVDKGLLISQN